MFCTIFNFQTRSSNCYDYLCQLLDHYSERNYQQVCEKKGGLIYSEKRTFG